MIHSHGFSYYCNADDTQLYLSFPPDYFAVSARISDCLFDISAWMKAHHLQLNLSKTEPLFVPAKPTIKHEISIKIDSISLSPTKVARNLEVMMDDQLTFYRSCCLCHPAVSLFTIQYKKDQALPKTTGHPTPGTDHGYPPPQLLQHPSNRPPTVCCNTFTLPRL